MRRPRRPRLHRLEALEPRILFSADVSALGIGPEWLADATPPSSGEHAEALLPDAAPSVDTREEPATAAPRHEIVFIDGALPDAGALAAAWLTHGDAGTQVDVVMLDAQADGLAQITETLQDRHELDAIHIVSHAAPGQLRLGQTVLQADTLDAHAAELQAWRAALGEDADLLLWGCDLAASADGQALIEQLAQRTGADVAASTNRSGSGPGADTLLEAQVGTLGTATEAAAWALRAWGGELSTYTVTNTLDDGSTGSLRWAITQANANAGTDTIGFAIGATGSAQTITLSSLLPTITDAVVIDARTQGGTGYTSTPLIRLDSGATSGLAQEANAFNVTGGGSTIAGFSLTRFGSHAIVLQTGGSNVVIGNAIGIDAGNLNDTSLYNYGDGIRITNSSGNRIGGTARSDANVITYNLGIGIAIAGSSDQNALLGNSVLGNGAAEIDLGADGVTANDNLDGDSGANSLQNSADLSSATVSASGTRVVGTLNSQAGASYRIEFFSIFPGNAEGSNHGGARRYLGYVDVTTDGAGNASYDTTLAAWVNAGDVVTTTATRILGPGNFGATSEFGVNRAATSAGGVIVVNTNTDVVDGTTSSLTNLAASRGADNRISLREAIAAANNTANGGSPDLIAFDIFGWGPQTITLSYDGADADANPDLMGVYQTATIDASTQPGFGGTPLVILQGHGAAAVGLDINGSAANGSTVRGLSFQGFTQTGLNIGSSQNNHIVGNWFGLNAAGTAAAANVNYAGIVIWNANNNLIGGSTAADRNVVSGSSNVGIVVNTDNGSSTGNQISGNYIGTDATGSVAVGNISQGVWINAANTTLGGTSAGQGNVISGTTNWVGVDLTASASGALIAGNLIGLNAAGTAALGNLGGGLNIASANNTIGGTTAAARNVISGNAGFGIHIAGASATGNVVIGNYIGTDVTGTVDVNGTAKSSGQSGVVLDGGATNNRVGTNADGSLDAAERNIISGNNWYGIEFLAAGTTGNIAQGNYIGTDLTGLVALGNAQGGAAFWNGVSGNRLGSGASGAGNVIAANETGVLIANGVSGNLVQGNLIGLGADGSTVLGNTGVGVYLYNGGTASAVTGNIIGTNGDGSQDATERNVISGNYRGVALQDVQVSGNTVAGNYIGTDASGLLDRGNSYDGVYLLNGANANTVGGSLSVQGNVIAGNGGDGIRVADENTDNNILRGNRIGVNAAGSGTLANDWNGIHIEGGADGTLIGGSGAHDGNWIAGNVAVGIQIDGASTGTVIQGNRIGTDLTGTANWGHQEEGIWLHNGASGTRVGGTSSAEGNIIAFSGQGGTWTPGIAVWDAGSTGNVVLGNSIYGSVGQAIDLNNDGADTNDAGDSDTGPNNLQNVPLLGQAVTQGTTLTITGSLNAQASSHFRIEFFSNPAADANGHGEGATYLGYANVDTDASGLATYTATLTATVAVGASISATATRSNASYDSFFDTSEFAANVTAVSPNTAPTGSNGSISVTEDTLYTFTRADFGFADVDGHAFDRVWIDSLPGSGTLRWSGASFSAGNYVTAADIDAGLLTYTPAANVHGAAVASFSFRVQDAGGTVGGGSNVDASANTLSIDITAVNDAPTGLVAIPDLAAADLRASYSFALSGELGRDGAGGDAPLVFTGSPSQTTSPSAGPALALPTGSYGEISSLGSTGGAMTLASWVRFDSSGDWQRVFDLGQTNSTGLGNVYVGRMGSTNDLTFTIERDLGGGVYEVYRATAAGAITSGQWLHFAATVDAAGHMQLYVNGELAATQNGTVPLQGVRDHAYVGHSNWAGDAPFDGALADLVIADGHISAAQATALYQQSSGLRVAENSANGSVVGTVQAIDPDLGDSVSYTLLDDAGGRFSIDAQGVIRVADGSRLDHESQASHSVQVRVTDGGGASIDRLLTVWVLDVDEAPTHGLPAAPTTPEDTALVFSSANGNAITLQDVDAGGADNELTIRVTQGTLSLSGTAGLSFAVGDGTDDATITVRGSAAAINAALDGLRYTPAANYHGGDTLTISSTDSQLLSMALDAALAGRYAFDNAAQPGDDSSPAGTHDATATGTPTVVADATRGSVLALDGSSHLTITGRYGQPASLTMAAWTRLDGGGPGGAEVIALGLDVGLRLDSGGGLHAYVWTGSTWETASVGTWLAGTGWHHVAMTLDDAAHELRLFIDGEAVGIAHLSGSVVYTGTATNTLIGHHGDPSNENFNYTGRIDEARIYTRALSTDEIALLARDAGLVRTDTLAITVSPVDDAPTLSTSGGSLNYSENAGAQAIDTGLTLADIDSAQLTGATVQITTAYAAGQDLLAFTDTGSITGSWNAATGTLTLSGNASVAQYQAALRSVTYTNLSEDPSIAVRTVSFSANDGSSSSAAATRQVQVVSINDAPTTADVSASGAEDAASITVTLSGSDVDGSVDRFRLSSLPAHGSLYLDAAHTLLAATGTDYAATGQALTLYFVPAADWNGSTSFSYVARDAQGGTDATPATASLVVTPVNDAPVLTLSGSAGTYTEGDAPIRDPGATLSDVDSADFNGGRVVFQITSGGGAGDTLSVNNVGNGAGQIGVSGTDILYGGTIIGTWAGAGDASTPLVITLNANASLAATQALLREISFANTSDNPSPGPRQFSLSVEDGDGGTSNTATATITVVAVNDAPQVHVVSPRQTDEDVYKRFNSFIGNAITVSDPDAGTSLLELTITPSHGTVDLGTTFGVTLISGDGSGDTLVILRGTLAALNTALDGLTFHPDADYHGPAAMDFSLNDLGATGSGGAQVATATQVITVLPVNDAPTGQVTITGTPTENQTLTADTSTVADVDGLGAYSYQWLRDGVAIAGANAASYTLGDADVGAQITVVVSYLDAQGSAESLTSAAVGPVANVNDAPTGNVTINGTPTEDQTLSADTSSLADADGLGAYSYQWLRDGVAISGATTANYTLGDADVGTQISVSVSYVDGQGTAESLTSAAVGPVANVNDAPTGSVTITGTSTEDQTLSADTSSLADADGLGAYSYQWLRDGVAVSGANAASYTLGDADVGTQISVSVSYVDGQGTAESLTSTAVGPIANVNDAPTGSVTITGSPTEDQTLSADTSALADADGLGVLNFQWLRDGVAISGANGASYTLGDADVGAQVSVAVSYVDGQGTAESLTSTAVGPIAKVNDAPTGSITITGTPTEDQALSADTSTLADADGLGAFSYQWLRDGVAITGATTANYTLGDADVGAQISVSVSYIDAQGTAESLTSAAVGPIANVNDAPTGAVTITGSPTEDQTLSADTSSLADIDGLGAFSYQWLRDGLAISGATGSSYALGDADVGAQISVTVSYVDGQGTAESMTSATVGPIANVNDVPTGSVTIDGTPTEDQTLSANTSTLADADGLGTLNYQWLRNGVAITGATGSSYTLSDADVGTQIAVTVSYVDGQGTAESMTSTTVGPVGNLNDAPTGSVTITGTSTEDQTLSADTSALADADGLGALNFQWLRNGVAIAGANAASYTLGDADVGTQISVAVSYVDGQGTAESLTSAAVGPVANINDAPTGNVTINGTPTEDQTLSADTSVLADADGLGAYSYQWLRDGVAIAGANAASYMLGDADVGTQISVVVSYVDGQGSTESLTSAAVGPVANVNDAPIGSVTIHGTPTEDQTLSADTSTLADADGLGAFTIQWLRNGVAISGANGASYILGNADVGTQISVTVSYVDGKGSTETLTSAAVGPVANVNDAPTGGVTIHGTPTEDQTLSVDTSSLTDADGLGAFNIQWLRNGVAISGANGASYILGDADVGTQISVTVSYVDGQGTAESLTSATVGPVANVNDAPTGSVTINGTPTEDQTLSADTSSLADADGLGAYSYQWLRNGIAVSGATTANYMLGDADVGTQISVVVSYVDAQGAAESLNSAAVGPIANVNDAPTSNVTIQGTPTEDQTLSADTSSLADADGLGAFSYQWLRDGIAVTGATTSTYTLGAADVGHQLSVRVSYLDGQGSAEALTSAPTGPVGAFNHAPTSQDLTRVTDEDTPLVLTAADFAFMDVDAGQTLQSVRITVLPGAGRLSLDGQALQGGDTVSLSALAGGRLVFTPAADANGAGYATLSFVVSDGQAESTVHQMVIDVRAVDDAAHFGAADTVNVGTRDAVTLGTGDLWLSDVDSDVQTMQILVQGSFGGHLEDLRHPGTAIASFTWTDLSQGQIRFVADGQGQEPWIELGVETAGSHRIRFLLEALTPTPAPQPVDPGPSPSPALPPTPAPGPAAGPAAPGSPAAPAPAPAPRAEGEDAAGVTWTELPAGTRRIESGNADVRQSSPGSRAGNESSAGGYANTPSATAATEGEVNLDLPAAVPARFELASIDPGRIGRHEEAAEVRALERLEKLLDALRAAPGETAAVVLSAGFVWWSLRAAGLVASLLASTPVWRQLDPIPVLGGDDDPEEEVAAPRKPSDAKGRGDEGPETTADEAEALRDEAASRELFDDLHPGTRT